MNPGQKALIEKAVGCLRIRDVFLHEAKFRRPVPLPSGEIEAVLAGKRAVTFKRGKAKAEAEASDELDLLQVQVALGVRVLKEKEEGVDNQDEEGTIFVEIEADFMVEYEVTSEVDEEAIKAFADFNSVHNVWPFWRQHVFDIVSRGRLPPIEIPLFSGSDI